MTDKPHLLIFNPDQFRYDGLGHSGNPCAVTPNLDSFARSEGVSFSHAFCQNPVCTPSRCSFMTGIAPGHTHFGRSLLPLLADARAAHRDAVFCEGGRLHGERHCMEFESTSSSDPAGPYWPRVNLQQSEGPEHTKAVMCRTSDFKYVRRLYETDELYDLRADPRELDNRSDDPALAAKLAELRLRLLTFFMETADVVPHRTDAR